MSQMDGSSVPAQATKGIVKQVRLAALGILLYDIDTIDIQNGMPYALYYVM